MRQPFTINISGMPPLGFTRIGPIHVDEQVSTVEGQGRSHTDLPGSPWETLGIDRNASQEAIEAAFRRCMEVVDPGPNKLRLIGVFMGARRKALDYCAKHIRERANNPYIKSEYGDMIDAMHYAVCSAYDSNMVHTVTLKNRIKF